MQPLGVFNQTGYTRIKFITELYIVTIYAPLVIISFALLQVAKLFQKIQEMVEEESNLVFVLIGQASFVLFSVNLFVCFCIRCIEFVNTKNSSLLAALCSLITFST